jgi:hypothetical protein
MKTTLDVALALAGRGLPVFPCGAKKLPTCPHGFKDAACDPCAVRMLWRAYTGPLIGVPTGAVSGIFVVDIDSTKHDTAKEWLERHAPDIPETRRHKTQSGGLHLLFKHQCGLPSTVSRLARGVDTRGEGGYIVWWPAEGFEVIGNEMATAPEFIVENLNPPSRVPGFVPRALSGAPPNERMRGIIERVVSACEGERNSLTFWGACVIRDMVSEGDLDANDARAAFAALAQASRYTGLPEREIIKTIASATARSR